MWPIIESFVITKALGEVLRALRQRITDWEQRKEFLAVIAARAVGIEVEDLTREKKTVEAVLEHPDWPTILTIGDVDRASAIGGELLGSGSTENQRRAVGHALIEVMQQQADPVFRALTDQTRRLDAGFSESLDKGLGADWMPELLLERLIDDGVIDHIEEPLPDRDGEIAYLLYRWSHPVGYEVVVGPPYSGKSTLLAYAIAHRPDQVDVVSFFVRRASGRNTRGQFLDVVTSQLRALLDTRGPELADASAGSRHFVELWDQACKRAAEQHRPLVLVVDALDEQAAEERPISSMLPAIVEDWVTVCVSTRPNPGNFVLEPSTGHPFEVVRADPWRIEPTAGIRGVRRLAEAELRSIFGQLGGVETVDPVAQDILVALAVFGHPIDLSSLADLVGVRFGEVDTRAATMRTVAQLPGEEVELGHDTYRETIRAQHGRVKEMQQRVHRWVEGWSAADWPACTPPFLLTSYPRTVTSASELLDLLTPRYRSAVAGHNGHLRPVLLAIEECTGRELATDDHAGCQTADHVRLALLRIDISRTYDQLPSGFVVALLASGQVEKAIEVTVATSDTRRQAGRAVTITKSIGADPEWADLAIRIAIELPDSEASSILSALAEAGYDPGAILDFPSSIARSSRPPLGDWPRTRVLIALAGVGHDLETISELAADLPDEQKAHALVALANAGYERDANLQEALRLGLRLHGFARQAIFMELARAGYEPGTLAARAPKIDNSRLCDLAIALAEAGADTETIVGLAKRIDNPLIRADVLVALAEAGAPPSTTAELRTTLYEHDVARVLIAHATAGHDTHDNLSAAARMAEDITRDKTEVIVALARAHYSPRQVARLAAELNAGQRAAVLLALADAGHQPAVNVAKALELAAELDGYDRSRLLLRIASTGHHLDQVACLASDLGPAGRARVLVALAEAGHLPEQNLSMAAELTADLDDEWRARVLAALAQSGHDPLELIPVAELIDEQHRSEVLVQLAKAGADTTSILRLSQDFRDHRADVLIALAKSGAETAAITTEAAHLPRNHQADVIVALASGCAEPEVVISLATDLSQATLGEVLLELAKRGHDPDRVLDLATRLDHRRSIVDVLQALADRGDQPDRIIARAKELGDSERGDLLIGLIRAGCDPSEIISEAADLNDYSRAWVLSELANQGFDAEVIAEESEELSDYPQAHVRIALAAQGYRPDEYLSAGFQLAVSLDEEPRASLLRALARAGYPATEIIEAAKPLDHGRRAEVLLALPAAECDLDEVIRLKGHPGRPPGIGWAEWCEYMRDTYVALAEPGRDSVTIARHAADLPDHMQARVLAALARSGADPDLVIGESANLDDAHRARVLLALAESTENVMSARRFMLQALQLDPKNVIPQVIVLDPSVGHLVLAWLRAPSEAPGLAPPVGLDTV